MSSESERDAAVAEINDAEWLELKYSRTFTDEEFALLVKGFIGKDMDTKWNFYFEYGDYILERSWTKTPIFKIIFNNKEAVKAYTKIPGSDQSWSDNQTKLIDEVIDRLFELDVDAKIESISKQMILWHHACRIGADVSLLSNPRPHYGAILFLIGGIDYLCQPHEIDDILFSEISVMVLEIIGFEKAVVVDILVNFFGKEDQDSFSLNACINGGNRLKDFVAGNTLAALSYGAWIEEWAKIPNLPARGQQV